MNNINLKMEDFKYEEKEINETVDSLKKKLADIKNKKRLLIIEYIKEWIIINHKSFEKDNIGIEVNDYEIKLIGYADSGKDINSFKIVIYINKDFESISMTARNEHSRYWEKEYYTHRLFYYKEINNVLWYLKKNLPVRINYRKQRSENELYKNFKLKNVW